MRNRPLHTSPGADVETKSLANLHTLRPAQPTGADTGATNVGGQTSAQTANDQGAKPQGS